MKTFIFKVTEDGTALNTERTNNGFGLLEIIGALEYEKSRYIKQPQDGERQERKENLIPRLKIVKDEGPIVNPFEAEKNNESN